MSKSKDQKTKPFELENEIVRLTKLYDEETDSSPVIHEPMTNTFMTEKQLMTKFEKEEQNKPFIKNKKPIAQRREQSKSIPKPQVPLKLDVKFPQIEKEVLYLLDEDKTLERLEEARNKPSPEFFRGLGIFLPKKI